MTIYLKSQDMIATLKKLSQKYEANVGSANPVPDEDRRRASRRMSGVSCHQEQEVLLGDRSMASEVSPPLTLRSKAELTSQLGQTNYGGEKRYIANDFVGPRLSHQQC